MDRSRTPMFIAAALLSEPTSFVITPSIRDAEPISVQEAYEIGFEAHTHLSQ
jgi:hypothetical protein